MSAGPLTGLIGVLALIVALVLGVPIGVALGLTGIVGLTVVLGLEPAIIKSGVILFDTASRYELGVLPIFLLMAHLCFAANASRDFFDAAARLIGHRRGGLALAAIGGCAGFGTISGSSLATTATIGLVAVPEMRQRGYAVELATGAVAAGGTLGQMVPPSGALIVFGIIAEQSIGKLFTAALLPALTQILLYCVVILVWCWIKPAIAPATERATWSQRIKAIRSVLDIGVLVALVIGGIAMGWFTPPEAASVGVVGALLLCAGRRRMTRSAVATAVRETLRTSGMIYVVIIGALIFSVFISLTGIAAQISQALGVAHGNTTLTLILMAAVLLVLGSILDGLALMLLTTPILLPIIQQMGLSPIWFGIFLVRAMEIGFIHPPVGMNLFIIQNIDREVRISQIFRGVLPFLAADFVHLLLLILIPGLALALPKLMGQ